MPTSFCSEALALLLVYLMIWYLFKDPPEMEA